MNLTEFLGWWRDGLVACVPAPLRRLAASPRPVLEVHPLADGTRFLLKTSSGRELDRHDEPYFPASERASETLTRWLGARRKKTGGHVRVCLAESEILATEVTLPAAAADNLSDVVGFELDRFTPFSAPSVYFGQRLLGRSGDSLRAEVSVVPRSHVDPLLQALARLGLKADGITVAGDSHGVMIRHGLAGAEPARRRPAVQLMLGATAATLVGLGLYLPFHFTALELAASEARMLALKRDAIELRRLEDRIAEALEGASAVAELKAAEVPTLTVLTAVTEAMPDNAWAYRFNRDDAEVLLQGEADVATELLARIEASPLLAGAAFRATVQKNTATGRDRFQISARIEPEAPTDDVNNDG